MKLSLSVIVGLVAAAASATATPVLYDINFTTASGVAPTAGSFFYDSATTTFTSFFVVWNGATLNLTASANSPNVAGVCDVGTPGGTGFDSFSYLSNPTCGAGNFEAGWSAIAGLSSVFGFSRNDNTSTDRISFSGAVIQSGNFIRGAGSFSIAPSAAVPEPSTIGLMLSGGILLAWRRKQRPIAAAQL